MAQAENTVHFDIGAENGSNNYCHQCSDGQLVVQSGEELTDEAGRDGFVEQYECINCNETGQYKEVSKTGQRRYTGVCADYEQ